MVRTEPTRQPPRQDAKLQTTRVWWQLTPDRQISAAQRSASEPRLGAFASWRKTTTSTTDRVRICSRQPRASSRGPRVGGTLESGRTHAPTTVLRAGSAWPPQPRVSAWTVFSASPWAPACGAIFCTFPGLGLAAPLEIALFKTQGSGDAWVAGACMLQSGAAGLVAGLSQVAWAEMDLPYLPSLVTGRWRSSPPVPRTSPGRWGRPGPHSLSSSPCSPPRCRRAWPRGRIRGGLLREASRK